jgi:hypothetical protein
LAHNHGYIKLLAYFFYLWLSPQSIKSARKCKFVQSIGWALKGKKMKRDARLHMRIWLIFVWVQSKSVIWLSLWIILHTYECVLCKFFHSRGWFVVVLFVGCVRLQNRKWSLRTHMDKDNERFSILGKITVCFVVDSSEWVSVTRVDFYLAHTHAAKVEDQRLEFEITDFSQDGATDASHHIYLHKCKKCSVGMILVFFYLLLLTIYI